MDLQATVSMESGINPVDAVEIGEGWTTPIRIQMPVGPPRASRTGSDLVQRTGYTGTSELPPHSRGKTATGGALTMANDESSTKTFNAAKLGKFTKNGDYTTQYDKTRTAANSSSGILLMANLN